MACVRHCRYNGAVDTGVVKTWKHNGECLTCASYTRNKYVV